MEWSLWLAYVGVITVLISSPGPSAMLCIAHGVKYGKSSALATVFGGTFASLTLMVLSAVGLGAILAASSEVFLLLKIFGALYLVYLDTRPGETQGLSLRLALILNKRKLPLLSVVSSRKPIW